MTGELPLEERVDRFLERHPDASVPAIAGAIDADPQAVRDYVTEGSSDSEEDSNTTSGEPSTSVATTASTTSTSRSGTRMGPQLFRDPDQTREVRILQGLGTIMGVDGDDYALAEDDVVDLPVMNAQPLVENGAAVVVGGPNDHRDDGQDETVDADTLLMAAMGDPDATDAVGTKDVEDDRSPSSMASGTTPASVGGPQSALPLGQLDALDHHERRRAAKKRGLEWPTTRDARDRLFATITEVMRNQDTAVVDAPTALGKSHTVATTSWGSEDQLRDATGGKPVVHLQATRDARDEAIEAAHEADVDHFVLQARHEACPVAAGDYDPPAADDVDEGEEIDYQPITLGGEAASEWISSMCEGRGLPFSYVHLHLDQHNDQGVDLPCCSGETSYDKEEGDFDDTPSECPAISQWEILRSKKERGELDLVFATHNFAHVPSLRMHTNIVLDEEPDFAQDLTTDRVRRSITAYLQAIDAPVSSWEAFIGLAGHDGWGDDAAAERDALQDAINEDPDPEWYFDDERAHTLAPALARAIFHAEERANGRRVGKTRYEPPRLDAGAVDEEGWNKSWVTVVLDEDNEVHTVRNAPDFGLARSVVGLDAHPARPRWMVSVHPSIQVKAVLEPEERRLWRRYERGLRVVQVGEATRPLASGEYFQPDQVRTLVEHLQEAYGERFRTAITASSVEDRLRTIMKAADCVDPSTMHYGEEKSRNDFGHERVGLVNGCIDPGDDFVVDLLAELDLEAEPETTETEDGELQRAHGRGFVGEDADVADEILASVRENHTAQAAGRYARDPDEPESHATVYVRTDAMPPGFADVQVPGVVWTFSSIQREIVEELRQSDRSLTARELADRAGCSKRHVAKTLAKLIPDEDSDEDGPVQAVHDAGPNGATLYSADAVPTSGVADLAGVTANDPVWDSYTWAFAIRDPDTDETRPTPDTSPVDKGVNDVPDWTDVLDPPG
ncbi:hypothetical protein [Halorarum salinum]|uniref:Uncharacterized protein n=1 Tax=Halorarum salinum TaxID=2743089 RepID=A0A7D5QCI9_9EURY|nr:hypothetical protein [Halobaculum salinum]QLG63099.1 hypothetical protein HUG12_15715 [Halobaculum salinum]